MRYMMTLTATDIMDKVHIRLVVRQWDRTGQAGEVVFERSTATQGKGETNTPRWARDALLEMVELL